MNPKEIYTGDLMVISTLGTVVYAERNITLQGEKNISIHNLAPGIYTLILRNEKLRSAMKIMVH
jgi:hypothetical protein